MPSEHVFREGRVFLRKHCPECGETEALLSSNQARWQRKRELCRFDAEALVRCTLTCETCRRDHHPRMVFVDVTNRCNMNCPICIANIPGMGFEFHPPLSYFAALFTGLGELTPRPVVQLFGGEPTVREDLFEIIELARSSGLETRVVTNGLKLADEEYCKRLCEAKVPVLIAFDGADPEIYERLRKNRGAYQKKLQAIENLGKYSRCKNTVMCCVARNINDRHMRDLIDFCHGRRSFIKCMHLIPLTETWAPGEFETDVATTTEDVEQIVAAAFPDEKVEFLPAGPADRLKTACKFFGIAPLRFGGVHPNCETATYMLSDGERYRPISHYLKRSLDDLAAEMMDRAARIEPRLARLAPDRWLQRTRGRLVILHAFLPVLARSVDLRKALKGSRVLAILRILGGLLAGGRVKDVVRRHTTVQDGMLMVVLPFEEYHSIEAARLQDCPSAFAFLDPDSGRVRTLPVCVWGIYKGDIQRRIMAAHRSATAESALAAS